MAKERRRSGSTAARTIFAYIVEAIVTLQTSARNVRRTPAVARVVKKLISRPEPTSDPHPGCVDSGGLLEVRLNTPLFQGSTIPPSSISRIAVGFNSLLCVLIDSGSSHYFISRKIVELNGFIPY